jgi:hypothetical protein
LVEKNLMENFSQNTTEQKGKCVWKKSMLRGGDSGLKNRESGAARKQEREREQQEVREESRDGENGKRRGRGTAGASMLV